jgi:hypothetical protein
MLLRIKALDLTLLTMIPYFWAKLAEKACTQSMSLPFFPLITASSVYNKSENQICAQLQTGRTQQKILSHNRTDLPSQDMTALQPSVFLTGINCTQVTNI